MTNNISGAMVMQKIDNRRVNLSFGVKILRRKVITEAMDL